MSCCCQKILSLCDVPICGGFISTGATATVTGIYKLTVSFLGIDYTISATINLGAEIKFPALGLNENYTFIGSITGTDGAQLTIEKGGVVYDCISFKTKISYSL